MKAGHFTRSYVIIIIYQKLLFISHKLLLINSFVFLVKIHLITFAIILYCLFGQNGKELICCLKRRGLGVGHHPLCEFMSSQFVFIIAEDNDSSPVIEKEDT